jgi:regulator of protease activity HflC (stomatin/prohibitin superfamily)
VRATLTYQIEDPLKYIFHFVNASNVVQDALNNAIVYASANFKVDDLLTHDKAGFKEAIRRRVADLLDKDDVGVNVNDCTVDAIPPRWQKVKDAFDAVLNAQIYRDKLLQDASTYTNKILTAAVASSNSIVDLAEAERLRLVNDLASRATNFSEILPLYQSNADLFVQQRLNGVMGVALTNVKETWFLPDSSGGNRIDLWLQLNRALPKPSTGTTNQ